MLSPRKTKTLLKLATSIPRMLLTRVNFQTLPLTPSQKKPQNSTKKLKIQNAITPEQLIKKKKLRSLNAYFGRF